MEAQQQVGTTTPVTISIRFGLLIAVVGVLIDFLVRVVGVSVLVYSIIAGGLALVVAIGGIILAHRAFRQANGGLMSYWQGILIALIALMISGIISALFNYLYVNYVDPNFVGHMKEEMVAFMERNRVPEDQIEKNVARLNDMSPSLGMGLLKGVQNGLIGGAVFGLIISIFTKRKPADFD